jgi:guanylate kinase
MTLHCIVGHSASGKSTIERKLELGHNMTRIISYTTRPKRLGERDGVDYHFISNEEFTTKDSEGFFAETASYNGWSYGLSLDGIDYQNNNYIVVVTPKGYEELLLAVGGEFIKSFFISVPERERMIRLAQRGDAVDEVIRRIQADRLDFAGFVDEANFIIENHEHVDKSVETVYTIIKCLNK